MEMTLQRLTSNRECVIGTLYLDGATECWTLEDPLLYDDTANVRGQTCIPEGRYKVVSLYSPKFGRMMPHLDEVPGRSQIEIHWGNTSMDTQGCILVGQDRLSDTMIGESRAAFSELEPKLNQAWANEEDVWIEVRAPAFVT